ncbi:MAG: nicotinate phosphoribosyltransferase [Calditrichaeota bacterium]|nr:MAG: nicotinate phosphoribosyltransferase [Calditrichota bacterium]
MSSSLSEGILFTDQYELTMAQLYFKVGLHEKKVQFEHYFREYPDYGAHQAGFCINAGLEWLCRWMSKTAFSSRELDCLQSQVDRCGNPVFHADFIEYLKSHAGFESLSLRGIPEGRVIHPIVPINIVEGPVVMAQILETALLNKLNYQILIATKAARIKMAAQNRPVLEFGMRRAHDLGANAGGRAALIGGADFSSNVGLSYEQGLDPKGTHAHSLVQLFLSLGYSELDAFRAFADLYPDNCILLVDTVNTLESGLPNAIKVFEELKRKGHEPLGVRIDSGDLAFLCLETAKQLDRAGFENAAIVLSNDLDELTIWQIITQIGQESRRNGMDADKIVGRLIYGVGTRLITSAGAPALGGVYKLTATFDHGKWKPSIKVSETLQKTANPGRKQAVRLYDQRGKAIVDIVGGYDENLEQLEEFNCYHPTDFSKKRTLHKEQIIQSEPLLVDVIKEGRCLVEFPSLTEIRQQRQQDIDKLDEGVKRLINPHIYHVSLTEKLYILKKKMLGMN